MNSESNKGYDYLDSLMDNFLGESQSTDDVEVVDSESLEQIEQTKLTIDGDLDEVGHDNFEVEKDSGVNHGLHEMAEETEMSGSTLETPNEGPTKRRVPLFEQMGLESSGVNSGIKEHTFSSVDIDSSEREEESSDRIKIEEEDTESGEEEKVVEDIEEDIIEDVEVNNNINISDSSEVKSDIEDVKDSGASELTESLDNFSFDDMLDDLTNLNKDELNEDSSKDEVIVPLYKPGMEDIKVTSDGRSLAEMIPGLRGGNKTTKEIIDNIREQKNIVEVNNKKFSDDRYLKHVKSAKKTREVQDERRKLSNNFIQRNAKFTEHEKIIMENLGVSNEGFASLMGAKDLTKKQKEKIIGLGKYGAEKHFKGRRYRTTIGDTTLLDFLTKFKFANTRILRWISNESQDRTWRKLNRLEENGLVESKSIIGIPDLWGSTPAGIAISGYSFKPGLRPMPKMITISSTMGINYIAACLWFNSVNVLNLDDFPAHNREIATQEDGLQTVRGEMLVSELEIRSSLGKEISPSSTTMQTLGDQRLYDVISANVRSSFKKWEDSGRVGESPEFALGNEFMWVLYPLSQLTLSYHVPDLVIKRKRGPNGEPRSIAVEMERYEKNIERYDKTMLAYKLDEYLYESVVWITPNNRVARALEKSAKNVGFTNYTIVPIITETGVYNNQDIWMI